MLTIYEKDLRSYFSTLTGYVYIAAILLVGGIYVYMNNFSYGYANFGESINNVPFFFIFLIPVLAAGTFTDEKRQKTDQLLYTLPMTSKQIVFGKYLALITVLAIPLLILGLYPLLMSSYGTVNYAQAYTNLLAIFLLGAALASICMFISSLAESIVISAVLCLAAMFVLYQMNTFSSVIGPSANRSFIGFLLLTLALAIFIWFMTKNIFIALIPSILVGIILFLIRHASQYAMAGKLNLLMNGMAVFSPLENFKAGVLDLYAVIYYLSVILLFVLFTVYTFERRRWK